MAVIGHVINSMYNVRNDLLIEKATGNYKISKDAFKAMIDKQKDLKEDEVVSAIDEAFSGFFVSKEKDKEEKQEFSLKFMEEELQKAPTLVLQDKNAA